MSAKVSGQRLPAHLASGGKAILAGLPDTELSRLGDLGPDGFARLVSEVAEARQLGYASNHQGTEHGLSAIGVALAQLPGPIRAAMCLAMPTARFRRAQLGTYVAALRFAARTIETTFAEAS
jgi:IclR family transcriptional regulator, acetate operon repressor